ncbi:MAG: 50S ribosomal protein L25 [Synergistaceae bacterium]|jgi:large subunit ribosomal protein L25|nr:50S ribosomal protein L25 [Synergistaceae bacterium]
MATKKENLKIEFTKRDAKGTGSCRKIRNKNMCPSILYGPEYKLGLAGTVSTKSIQATANSKNKETTLIELVLEDGNTVSTLIRDVQRHPITQQIRHIDFYQVLKGHKIKVDIPINIVNRELCAGIKEGGMIFYGTRLITVEIQPSDIPEQIDFDIKDLELGSEIYVRDIPVPEGSEVLTDGDTMVIHIAQPKVVEEEVEEVIEEEGTTPEVEVVAKGKEAKDEKHAE